MDYIKEIHEQLERLEHVEIDFQYNADDVLEMIRNICKSALDEQYHQIISEQHKLYKKIVWTISSIYFKDHKQQDMMQG